MDGQGRILKMKAFLCEGMAAGWAGGDEGTPIESGLLKGWSEIRYRSRNRGFAGLELVDRWGMGLYDSQSSAQTLILDQDIPVWGMATKGPGYPEELWPFLRQALLANYAAGEFLGGRGPETFVQDGNADGLTYYNYLRRGDFTHFEGTEEVHLSSSSKRPVGGYKYQGMLLVGMRVEDPFL